MRHLFIINPIAEKNRGRNDKIIRDIRLFLQKYSDFNYMIHTTRWRRDAFGYSRRYVQRAEGDTVRIHVLGGTGTLFEVVNGVFDLPNVQIAVYPKGHANTFLHYYGTDRLNLFNDLKKQVFGEPMKIDVMRCNNNYVMCYMIIGFEADAIIEGDKLAESTPLNNDICCGLMILYNFLRSALNKSYKMSLDGKEMSGEYSAISVATRPKHGKKKHVNNGTFRMYVMSKLKASPEAINALLTYFSGSHSLYTEKTLYKTGRKLSIEVDNPVCMLLDGELFYERKIDLEIIPGAVEFVCPDSIIADNTKYSIGIAKEDKGVNDD